MTEITNAFILILWVMGVVIAEGFWQTLFTIFPPYGIYVAVKFWLIHFGFLT